MPNRLANEPSPYLQQHANNPVDWYPWGPEALARAKTEDKPILLSIGYSACHWCHVMEHESFSNEETAKLMNELFVCIKVDREERPDLDHVYQLVVQLMGRSGGWPLTVFLTPEQGPFYGGTYFPPAPRYGMPSFQHVLASVADAYHERRRDVDAQAKELVSAIDGVLREGASDPKRPGPDLLERASRALARRFDDRNGGIGDRPKFPNTMSLDVLLRRGALEKDDTSLVRVRRALDAMRAGGIWDHLGGAFHRYSTDERWLVPHFEKMLYDNALLVGLYADGWRVYGEESFASTARDIVRWLDREMTSADGGFFSSQDADSEGEEGRFFVWTPSEVRAALKDDAGAIAVALERFGVTDEGNFEKSDSSVLHAAKPVAAVAIKLGIAPSEVEAATERARHALFEVRERRPKPFRDEKVLTSWNALFIRALADASLALGEPGWLAKAARAYAYVRERLTRAEGDRLRALRLAKDGVVKGEGFLDDHSYLACAALALYQASGDPRYVADARALARSVLAHFHDAEDGGFFFAPDDGEKLVVRGKDPFDQAVPSGAACACEALLVLGSLSDERYATIGAKELERVAGAAMDNPFAFGATLGALDRLVRGAVEVVLVGSRADARTQALAQAAARVYMPHRTIAWVDPSDPTSIEAARALAADKPAGSVPRAFVCRGRTCSLPVEAPEALDALLRT
jgi:uncharacterized protein YyaL (SSP411 family)